MLIKVRRIVAVAALLRAHRLTLQQSPARGIRAGPPDARLGRAPHATSVDRFSHADGPAAGPLASQRRTAVRQSGWPLGHGRLTRLRRWCAVSFPEVVFTKRDAGWYSVHAIRGDGAVVVMPTSDRRFRVPPDLAHFAVERELGLADGVFGTGMPGGLFGKMRIVAARRRHDDRQRGADLARASSATHAVAVAEVLAGVVHQAVGPYPSGSVLPHVRAGGRRARRSVPFTLARSTPPAALDEFADRWTSLDTGCHLTMPWTVPVAPTNGPACLTRRSTATNRAGDALVAGHGAQSTKTMHRRANHGFHRPSRTSNATPRMTKVTPTTAATRPANRDSRSGPIRPLVTMTSAIPAGRRTATPNSPRTTKLTGRRLPVLDRPRMSCFTVSGPM